MYRPQNISKLYCDTEACDGRRLNCSLPESWRPELHGTKIAVPNYTQHLKPSCVVLAIVPAIVPAIVLTIILTSDVIGLEGIWIGLDWILFGWSGSSASDIWIGLDQFDWMLQELQLFNPIGQRPNQIRQAVTQMIALAALYITNTRVCHTAQCYEDDVFQ